MKTTLLAFLLLPVTLVAGTATFTVDFDIDLTDATEGRLWEIPGAVFLHVREAGARKELFSYDQEQGNYLSFKLTDGTRRVAEVRYDPEIRSKLLSGGTENA